MLRLAAKSGSVAAVRARIHLGDALDATDPSGRTALMIAAAHGHLDVCRMLLEAGSDPSAKDSAGRNASEIASSSGHAELAAFLLPPDSTPSPTAATASRVTPPVLQVAPTAHLEQAPGRSAAALTWPAFPDEPAPMVTDIGLDRSYAPHGNHSVDTASSVVPAPSDLTAFDQRVSGSAGAVKSPDGAGETPIGSWAKPPEDDWEAAPEPTRPAWTHQIFAPVHPFQQPDRREIKSADEPRLVQTRPHEARQASGRIEPDAEWDPPIDNDLGEPETSSPEDDWEAEPAPRRPIFDPEVIATAVEVQDSIARHIPIDSGVDWSEIDAELPAASETATRGPSDPDLRARLRAALVRALRDGLARPEMIWRFISGGRGEANDHEAEALRHLLLCIADAGVDLDPDVPLDWGLAEYSDADLDPVDVDDPLIDEAVQRIEAAASGRDDPLKAQARNLSRGGQLLGRDDEVALALNLRTALIEAVRALCLHELSRSRLVAQLEARLAARGSASRDEPENDVDEDEAAENGARFDQHDLSEVAELAIAPLDECLAGLAQHDRDNQDTPAARQLAHWLHRAGFGLTEVQALRDECERAGAPGDLIKELDRRIQPGTAARDLFVKKNMRLVGSIARRYPHPVLTVGDLVQEGCIGLLRAIDGYDPDRGFRFSTYATWWIRQAISRAVADKGRLIRVPVHMHERIQDLRRAEERLQTRLGKSPTVQQLCIDTGLSEAEIRKVRRASSSVISIDDPDAAGWLDAIDAAEAFESPNPEDLLEAAQRARWLRAALTRLPAKSALIIAARHGLGSGDEKTLEEVGRSLEVTRERIRQIERKSMEKLRTSLELLQHGVLLESDEQRPAHPRRRETPPTPMQFVIASANAPEHPELEPACEEDDEQEHADEPAPESNHLSESASEPAAASVAQELARRQVMDAVRLLASPSAQRGMCNLFDADAPQRDFARRWFAALPEDGLHGVLNDRESVAVQQVTQALRSALRLLGFGDIGIEDLLVDQNWQWVVDAARHARELLDTSGVSSPPQTVNPQ